MTNWQQIKYSFERLIGAGTVHRVNMVDRWADDGTPYQSAFIRFRRWPETERAVEIRDRLLAGERLNVVYEDGSPWFWRCTLSRTRESRTT